MCNGLASICLSVSSIDNSNDGRRVCCCAPCDEWGSTQTCSRCYWRAIPRTTCYVESSRVFCFSLKLFKDRLMSRMMTYASYLRYPVRGRSCTDSYIVIIQSLLQLTCSWSCMGILTSAVRGVCSCVSCSSSRSSSASMSYSSSRSLCDSCSSSNT